jgi:hypothetical protein
MPRRLLAAPVLLAGLLLAAPVRAQAEGGGPVEVCRLPVDAPGVVHPDVGRPVRPAEACPTAERTATFEVEYVGFPDDARAAFQAAVDTWACRVVSSQTVRVRAQWEPLDGSTLGTAGPYLFRNFDDDALEDTWYPAALADEIAGRDLDADQPDVLARFNSTFTAWHLDPTVAPPLDRYDLYTVVVHEVAHGLGFIGALAVEDGLGYVGAPDRTRGAYAFDRFTEDAAGRPLLDARRYPDGSVALSEALRSSAVRFDGPAVRQGVGGPVPLYAPPAWDDGASYSHLDETAFAPGTADGLMTPFLARGESISGPGTAVCGVLADVGWALAGDCAARVGALPDVRAGIAVARTGPNPFARRTGLRLTPAGSGDVRATLIDAAGRRIAVLVDRSVGAGEDVDVEVTADGLAAGVYFVHVAAGADERLVPVVVVR